MSKDILTSVIIPSYEDDLRLEWALESLCRQDTGGFEVIVVNDGGSGETANLCQRFTDRLQIIYTVLEPHTPDFRVAAARNWGVKHSRGRILVFQDCDCIQPKNGISSHNAAQWAQLMGGKDHHVVACGGRRDIAIEDVLPYAGEFDYRRLHGISRPSKYTARHNGIFFIGCNISLQASLFCEIGGFDESYTGWGGEDTDLRLRLMYLGATGQRRVDMRRAAEVLHLDHVQRATHQGKNNSDFALQRAKASLIANGGPLVRFCEQ